jgi:hypothetical protein
MLVVRTEQLIVEIYLFVWNDELVAKLIRTVSRIRNRVGLLDDSIQVCVYSQQLPDAPGTSFTGPLMQYCQRNEPRKQLQSNIFSHKKSHFYTISYS